jgi:hypothetical protein
MAHDDEQATAAGKHRRRRKPRVSMAVAHGVWRLGHGWRRSRGGGALNSPIGHFGVRATREDACSGRTRSRRRSSGRSCCEEGDDRWAPSVSHCRRKWVGSLAGLAWEANARWVARLGRVRRPAAARACWAGNSWRATAPLAGLLGWRCCWVGLQDRIGVDGLGIGFRN